MCLAISKEGFSMPIFRVLKLHGHYRECFSISVLRVLKLHGHYREGFNISVFCCCFFSVKVARTRFQHVHPQSVEVAWTL